MSWGIAVRIVLLGCAAALCAPAAAGAKLPTVGVRSYSARITGGTMTLTFHGDEASGCAGRGLCGVSGTVTAAARSSQGGVASLFTSRSGVLGVGALFETVTTSAVVHTSGAADCVDQVSAAPIPFGLAGPRHARVHAFLGTDTPSIDLPGGVTFGASGAGATVFDTHCAGPLPLDLRVALPQTTIHRAALAHRSRIALDFKGTRSFAAGGFAGTISSDVRLVLRRQPCRGRTARRSCRAFDLAVAG